MGRCLSSFDASFRTPHILTGRLKHAFGQVIFSFLKLQEAEKHYYGGRSIGNLHRFHMDMSTLIGIELGNSSQPVRGSAHMENLSNYVQSGLTSYIYL
ncbi:hypothetical protein KP509_33G037600 [Ceratopteris richardii]|nr:hypothetical protein KP509_33G037600 [Ceratopteris richardii]